MHLVLMTRGVVGQVEEWISILRAQRFPWKRKNLKNNKEEMMLVQGALRPIQFWEYVFPEESLNDVMGGMLIKGPIERAEIKNVSWWIRKMLKLEPIPVKKEIPVTGYSPQVKLDGKQVPAQMVHDLRVDGVAVYPLGIKKDFKKDHKFKLNDGTEAEFFQEGL